MPLPASILWRSEPWTHWAQNAHGKHAWRTSARLDCHDSGLRCAGVTQKYLVVTANYPARARGVGKLMGIVEVRRQRLVCTTLSGLRPCGCRLRLCRSIARTWQAIKLALSIPDDTCMQWRLQARKRCPELVLVSGEDLTPYRRASKGIMGVLSRFGPAERLGLDEVRAVSVALRTVTIVPIESRHHGLASASK